MPAQITPRMATLALINEAISAIDACQEPNLSTHEIAGLLLEAREQLTSKPWPAEATSFAPDADYQAFVLARIEDQLLDGRQ